MEEQQEKTQGKKQDKKLWKIFWSTFLKIKCLQMDAKMHTIKYSGVPSFAAILAT